MTSLKQQETWFIHPTTMLLPKVQMEINIPVMGHQPLVSSLGIVLASTNVWLVPEIFSLVPTAEV